MTVKAYLRAYRYKVYDITIDDYRYSSRMATREHIARIGGVPIAGTEAEIDSDLLPEGWTAKNFDPAPIKEQPTIPRRHALPIAETLIEETPTDHPLDKT
jgi:hypothetical protein